MIIFPSKWYLKSFLVGLILLFAQLRADAQSVPIGMTYQGRLTDASNASVPDGSGYEIEVRLWSSGTGGTLLWGTRYTGVPIKGGAFSLILGAGGTAIPGASTTDIKEAFSTPTVHLGLTTTKNGAGTLIPSPTEILPRQQLLSSPYAFRAEVASSVQADGVLSSAIKDGEVKAMDLAPNAVTTQSIADGTVSGSDLAPGAATANLVAGSIPPDRVAFDYAVFEDRRASGTSPGTSTTGWNTRVIGSSPVVISGSSIALVNNTTFSLQPGTYFIEADCPTLQALNHQAAIFESSNPNTALLLGPSGQGRIDNASGPHFSTSNLRGYLTVTVSGLSYVLRQYLPSGSELGRPASSGQQEVYSRIHILRIK